MVLAGYAEEPGYTGFSEDPPKPFIDNSQMVSPHAIQSELSSLL